jgi:hypothetical protein
MYRALLADRDLHLEMAALMLSISYEEAARRRAEGDPVIDKARDELAKPANFGLPGGMGPNGLIAYARGYGYRITKPEAERAHLFWKRRWPELSGPYSNYIRSLLGPDGYGGFVHPISGRIYGRGLYTELCNARFQGRAADGAKAALYETVYRCYVDRKSPLYGSRPVVFVHDEIIAEVPEENAHEAAFELARVMCESMGKYCHNVPIKAKPALMRRWYKKAKDVYDAHGRLVPWEPKAGTL